MDISSSHSSNLDSSANSLQSPIEAQRVSDTNNGAQIRLHQTPSSSTPLSPIHSVINRLSNTLFTASPTHNNSDTNPIRLNESNGAGRPKAASDLLLPIVPESSASAPPTISPPFNNSHVVIQLSSSGSGDSRTLFAHPTRDSDLRTSTLSLTPPLPPDDRPLTASAPGDLDVTDPPDVRTEVIEHVLAGELNTRASMRIFRLLQLSINIAEIALIIAFLTRDWKLHCDYSGMRVFLIVRGVIDGCQMMLHLLAWSTLRTPLNKVTVALLRLTDCGFTFYALVVVAMSKECNQSTLWLTIALCIVTGLTILAPIVLLVSVCICFPIFLRFMAEWVELQTDPGYATSHQIEKIEKSIWSDELLEQRNARPATECPVCLVSFEDGNEVNILPCGHTGHHECHTNWLKIRRNCPQCRRDPFALEPHERRGEGLRPRVN